MAQIYQARQRDTDRRWDYTLSSDEENWCHALGYCAGWHEFQAGKPFPASECLRLNTKILPFKDKYHTDGHATVAEAHACYREYILDQELHIFPERPSPDHLHRCQAPECERYTSGMITCGSFNQWMLCDEHRTRATVEQLLPA